MQDIVYHYAGIDLHKKYSYITVIDNEGQKVYQDKIKNDQFALQKALLQLNNPNNIKAAVEATFNAYWLVDTLGSVNIDTKVVHPTKTKAIASAKIKTDKIDSEILAELHQKNMLPLSYIPTAEEQRLKDIVRFRLDLVQQRSRLKSKVQAILLRNCIFEHPYSDIFGKGGQKWLRSLKLKEHENKNLLSYLELINSFTEEIDKQDETIKEFVKENYKAKLLQTIPGVGPIIALTLVAEIGNVERFPSGDKLASYAGLVPSTYSSGGKTTHGQVTKAGNPYLRYASGEAVIHLIKKNKKLKEFYEKKSESKGKSKAKVACMRKLLTYVYVMLKHNLKYDQLDIAND